MELNIEDSEEAPTIVVVKESLKGNKPEPLVISTAADANVHGVSSPLIINDTEFNKTTSDSVETIKSDTIDSMINPDKESCPPGDEPNTIAEPTLREIKHRDYRYEIESTLGQGGSGIVYSAQDINLNREVAIKVLSNYKYLKPSDIKDFIEEGQIVANLQHPSIIPIHDLKEDADGKLYLTMQKITGKSLKEYTKKPTDNSATFSINDAINIFIKVCDALSLAHSKNIYHQDIKPENIMIGEYGEVYVIDWGAAINNEDQLSLTPQYMSPEQSAGFDADARSDIFNLGATIYHLLFKRYLNKTQSIKKLFTARQNGTFPDTPQGKDTALVPAALQAIVFKAIAFDPDERYQTIEGLREDLINYQAGQAISVYKDTLYKFLERWVIRHKQQFFSALLLTIVTLILGTYIYQQKLKEIAYWGAPIFTDTFSSPTLNEKWVQHQGIFNIENGSLVTSEGNAFFCFYKDQVSNSCAIEFDAEIQPGSIPCDLSAIWCENVQLNEAKDTILSFTDPYLLQNGAYENSCSMIFQKGQRLAYNPYTLEVGRTYKVRAQVDYDTLSIFVDGEKLCEYKSIIPFTSGHIGLYGYFSGKSFDNVKIYSKGVAEKVPATATGDYAYSKEQYLDAQQLYAEIARAHKGKKIAQRSLFMQGLCVLKRLYGSAKAYEGAELYWNQVTDQDLLFLIKLHELNNPQFEHKPVELKEYMKELYLNAKDNRQQGLIKNTWGTLVADNVIFYRHSMLKALLELKEEYFDNDPVLDFSTACALYTMGKYEDVISKYKHIKWYYSQALIRSGRIKEILPTLSTQTDFNKSSAAAVWGDWEQVYAIQYFGITLHKAYFNLGRPEQIFADFPNIQEQGADAHFLRADYSKVLTDYPKDILPYYSSLRATGQFKELKSQLTKNPLIYLNHMVLAGQYNELQELPYFEREFTPDDAALLMIGDSNLAAKHQPNNQLVSVPLAYLDHYRSLWEGSTSTSKSMAELDAQLNGYYINPLELPRYTLPALMAIVTGNKAKATEYLKEIATTKKNLFEQRLWHNAAFILGDIPQEMFLLQPQTHQVDSRLTFALAVKAEYNNSPVNALEHYLSYQKIPQYQKEAQAIINEFVEWRISQLM